MGKLQERKADLARRLAEVKDPQVLDAVEAALDPQREPPLSDREFEELKQLKARYLSGEEKGTAWATVKRRLQRDLRS